MLRDQKRHFVLSLTTISVELKLYIHVHVALVVTVFSLVVLNQIVFSSFSWHVLLVCSVLEFGFLSVKLSKVLKFNNWCTCLLKKNND